MTTAHARHGPALLPSVLAAEDAEGHNTDDATRPLVFGYVDATQLSDEAEVSAARARLSEYAVAERLHLGSVYVDQPGNGGSMFRALLASIERYNPAHVLVPSVVHMASICAGQATKRQYIESCTGATVRVIDNP